MERKMATFRLSKKSVEMLKELASKLNESQSAIVQEITLAFYSLLILKDKTSFDNSKKFLELCRDRQEQLQALLKASPISSVVSMDSVTNEIIITPNSRHKTLDERFDGVNVAPYELTEEDKEWLEIRPVGEELDF